LIEVPAFTATFTPTVVFDGVPAVFECRYALIANWAGSSETVATGPAFLYQNPTYA
jgi:hypothetical protein